MKSNKKIVKKSTSAMKPAPKKGSPKPKVVKSGVPTKKVVISKKVPQKVKKIQGSRKSKKTRPMSFKRVVVAAILIIIASVVIVVAPGVWSAIKNRINVLGSETSEVTEDQLAMFATLAYEGATHNKTTDTQESTPSFAVCDSVRGTLDLVNEVTPSGSVKDCMTNPSSFSSDLSSNMFTANTDFLGNNKITLPDNAYVTDKLVNYIANLMANTIQIEEGQHYYFNDLINIESASEDFLKNWVVVDSYSQGTASDSLKYFGKVSALTFLNPTTKEVVIAYRGTDLTDAIDWLEDLVYGVANDSGQDKYAENYAKYISDIYSDDGYKIYITGHSLGAYLAQVGAAKLINIEEDGTANAGNLQRVVYFNGMGLFAFKKSLINPNPSHSEMARKFILWNSSDGTPDDKIMLVHMNGDPVSSIGVHYGQVKTLHASHDVAAAYNAAYTKCLNTKLATLINNAKGRRLELLQAIVKLNPGYKDKTISQLISLVPSGWRWLVTNDGSGAAAFMKVLNVLGMNINTSTWSSAWKENSSKAFLAWMMTVHPTDSFFYTKTYYNMCINGTNKTNCAYLSDDKYTPPTKDSIDSEDTDEKLGQTTTTVYSQMTCRFVVTPSLVIKGNSITGKITCYSPVGISDTIDTSKITEEYGYSKLSVGSITAISDDNINKQSWNVILNAKTGAVHPTGKTWMWIDKGFVKDLNGQKNESVRSNQIVTQDSRPQCKFTMSSLTVRRGASITGTITCSDMDGINNSSLNKSKITEAFAHFKLSVGDITSVSDNDSTKQSWKVKLTAKTGIFNLPGKTWMILGTGFVKDTSGNSSYSAESSKITVLR